MTDLLPFLLTVLAILLTAFVVYSLVPLVVDSRARRIPARVRSRLHGLRARPGRRHKPRTAPWDRPSRLA